MKVTVHGFEFEEVSENEEVVVSQSNDGMGEHSILLSKFEIPLFCKMLTALLDDCESLAD
jgi:hypothetical protein